MDNCWRKTSQPHVNQRNRVEEAWRSCVSKFGSSKSNEFNSKRKHGLHFQGSSCVLLHYTGRQLDTTVLPIILTSGCSSHKCSFLRTALDPHSLELQKSAAVSAVSHSFFPLLEFHCLVLWWFFLCSKSAPICSKWSKISPDRPVFINQPPSQTAEVTTTTVSTTNNQRTVPWVLKGAHWCSPAASQLQPGALHGYAPQPAWSAFPLSTAPAHGYRPTPRSPRHSYPKGQPQIRRVRVLATPLLSDISRLTAIINHDSPKLVIMKHDLWLVMSCHDHYKQRSNIE